MPSSLLVHAWLIWLEYMSSSWITKTLKLLTVLSPDLNPTSHFWDIMFDACTPATSHHSLWWTRSVLRTIDVLIRIWVENPPHTHTSLRRPFLTYIMGRLDEIHRSWISLWFEVRLWIQTSVEGVGFSLIVLLLMCSQRFTIYYQIMTCNQ